MGIPDPAEDTRVGEGSLECTVLLQQCLAEPLEPHLQRLDPTRVETGEGLFSSDHMERGTLVRAGLREEERPVGEVQSGMSPLLGNGCTSLLPLEASGDHEMDHGEEIVLQLEHHPLPYPAESRHPLPLQLGDSRLVGAKE